METRALVMKLQEHTDTQAHTHRCTHTTVETRALVMKLQERTDT